MYVHELRDAGPSCGGKAQHLARLIAAGLPVPPGFVIDDAAFRLVGGEPAFAGPDGLGHALETVARRIADDRIPPELEREVGEHVGDLGARVVVRSSATIEDGEAGAAAGVFSSHAVPVADLWLAIRAVWTSALTPLAAAYARRRGQAIAIGVIVQREVEGEAVTVYTRAPGAPVGDELLVQRGDRLARHARSSIPAAIAEQSAAVQALRAERAIDAVDGADVELVQSASHHDDTEVIETWVVQARPIIHPKPRTLAPPPPIVLAALDDGRVWTWDVTHNPDPLSPAQAGLVERVERAGLGAYELRVCAGYLYTSPRPGAPPAPEVATVAELASRAAALEAKLATILDAPTSSLGDALDRYLAFYAVWAGELAPLIASARRSGSPGAHRPSSVEATLAAAARGDLTMADVEHRLGDLAPTWDVAIAPFGERPGLLRDAVANAVPGRSPDLAAGGALGALASDLAERDDLLFARAQRMVRRALLARAAELGLAAEDVCWLPLDEVVAGVSSDGAVVDADGARRRAAGARTAAGRAAQWDMPIVVGGSAEPAPGISLHGVGSGRRVVGRVVRFASLAAAAFVRAGDVVVVRAVTPALAVFIGRCAALVSETGGLLDHGAALARELGIPCVVGCRDAWTRLTDGTIVAVDGDAGQVTTITSISAPGADDHSSS